MCITNMASKDILGAWNITWMEMWDEDYFNEDGQAFIKINKNNSGKFKFGYVNAEIDGRIVTLSDGKKLEFTFDGNDEMDTCQGRGWIKLKEDDSSIIDGEFFFHMCDSSKFLAKRGDNK